MEPRRLHPASHCSLHVFSRSDGRSSVKAAAYAARTRMTDHRTGLVHNYSRLPGLLCEDLVNWEGTAEQLWNAAEASETRINARVGRELRPALPAELPLDEQRRLVHGFCCWLKDQHQIAAHWVIHAPNFHDPDTGKQLWEASDTEAGNKAYKEALCDPNFTNLNFHAHIRWTVRRVDKVTGTFGEKTREFDRTNPRELSAEERRDGLEPEEKIVGREVVKNIRSEWERRSNAALKRAGSSARICLRSYEDMAAAGDAPEGMQAQEHLGPRNSAKAREAEHPVDPVMPMASVRNAQKKQRNEERWKSWLELRNLEREKARLENEGAKIAADRERDRRARARKEKAKVAAATSAAEAEAALVETQSVDLPLAGISFEEITEWARSGSPTPANHEEFDRGIDPETYDNLAMTIDVPDTSSGYDAAFSWAEAADHAPGDAGTEFEQEVDLEARPSQETPAAGERLRVRRRVRGRQRVRN